MKTRPLFLLLIIVFVFASHSTVFSQTLIENIRHYNMTVSDSSSSLLSSQNSRDVKADPPADFNGIGYILLLIVFGGLCFFTAISCVLYLMFPTHAAIMRSNLAKDNTQRSSHS